MCSGEAVVLTVQGRTWTRCGAVSNYSHLRRGSGAVTTGAASERQAGAAAVLTGDAVIFDVGYGSPGRSVRPESSRARSSALRVAYGRALLGQPTAGLTTSTARHQAEIRKPGADLDIVRTLILRSARVSRPKTRVGQYAAPLCAYCV